MARQYVIGIFFLVLVIGGCDTGRPAGMLHGSGGQQSGALERSPSTSSLEDAIARLLTEKSVDALQKLLVLNGIDEGGIVEIGSLMGFARPNDPDVIRDNVMDVRMVQSSGHPFVIALAKAECDAGPFSQPPPKWKAQLVFVFDRKGQLLTQIGSTDLAESFGVFIQVTAFGTEDCWFVWVRRGVGADPVVGTKSEIYLVAPEMPKVLSMRHHHADPGFSNHKTVQRDGGTFFWFRQAGDERFEHDTKGMGADGTMQEPRIAWIANKKIFRGPSKITVNGTPVYQVDLTESKSFEALDLPK